MYLENDNKLPVEDGKFAFLAQKYLLLEILYSQTGQVLSVIQSAFLRSHGYVLKKVKCIKLKSQEVPNDVKRLMNSKTCHYKKHICIMIKMLHFLYIYKIYILQNIKCKKK